MPSAISSRLTRTAALVTLLTQLLLPVVAQQAPCIDPALTPADLANQLNPRPSSDVSVLLNLPFNRVFCSTTTAARFLIFGDWSERHQLDLTAGRLNNDQTNADVHSHTDWRVVNVSNASSMADFDFLVDESLGLRAGAEYFVAVRGCNSRSCATVGVTRFTSAGSKPAAGDSTVLIIIGVCGATVFAVALIVIVFVVRYRIAKNGTKSGEHQGPIELDLNIDSGPYLHADRFHQNQNGQPDRRSQMDSGPYEQMDGYTYEQIGQNSQLTTFSASKHDEGSNTYVEADGHVITAQQHQSAEKASTDVAVANPDYGHKADQTSSSGGTRERCVNGSKNPAYDQSGELYLSKNNVDGESRKVIMSPMKSSAIWACSPGKTFWREYKSDVTAYRTE